MKLAKVLGSVVATEKDAKQDRRDAEDELRRRQPPTIDSSMCQRDSQEGENQILGVTAADAAGGGTEWQAVKTANFTAAAGQGVFCNTTSAAFTLTLPAGTLGDEIAFVDYAGTFDSNALTIAPNGSEKIQGVAASLTVSVERAANTLVYTDGTQGWLLKNK